MTALATRRSQYPLLVAQALTSVAAAALSLGTVLLAVRGLPGSAQLQLGVQAVFIALSLVRADARGAAQPWWADLLARVVMVPLVALIALGLRGLAASSDVEAFAIIGVVLVAGVWLRRFGPVGARFGALLTFPFLAVVVTPVVPVAGMPGDEIALWGAFAALTAVLWAAILSFVVSAAGRRSTGLRGGTIQTKSSARQLRVTRRLVASDRMAVHLAIALAACILVGSLAMPQHLAWLVLTAYIVTAASRGRADAVYRGIERLFGAAAGTALAAWIGLAVQPGAAWAIVVIFLVLAAGAVARIWAYAWWAVAMTTALSLLYAYLGQGGVDRFLERLLAIAIAGLIAILTSTVVLPVRTRDVVRRRVGDVLIAARELLQADADSRPSAARAASAALDRLHEVRPPLVAMRALGRPALGDLTDDALALRGPLEAYAAAPSKAAAAEITPRLVPIREKLATLAPREVRTD